MTSQTDIFFKKTNMCPICGKEAKNKLEFPELPLTDTYCKNGDARRLNAADQTFLFCEYCQHGFLQNIIKPELLYNQEYNFRTSKSITARKGTDFFLNSIKELFPDRRFQTALDLGCNDLHLLKQLGAIAKRRIGIDPIWAGHEGENSDPEIDVYGYHFEKFDAELLKNFKPDLIMCRHTIEHITDPITVMKNLFKISADNAVFIFEFPALEPLIEKLRFDHIFHQHLHLFTLSSFFKTLDEIGGSYLAHRWNKPDWGALLVAFQKNSKNRKIEISRPLNFDTIISKYNLFSNIAGNVNSIINTYDGTVVGYGAAQMLPVLAYHWQTDLCCLNYIIDDDFHKDGLTYWNLPIEIKYRKSAEISEDALIMITAIDNTIPILKNISSLKNNIFVPVSIL